MTSGMQTSAPSLAAVGLLERGGQADRFGLAERPGEHRAGDRLQQPLAQLAPPDPGQRVQPGAAAGREPQDRSAERADEGFVFAFEVDDLAAAAEHPRAQQPRLRQARLAEVGASDHQRVRVVQDPAGVEDPGVVDEAAAVHVPADVDAPRARARPRRPPDTPPGNARSSTWCPGRSPGSPHRPSRRGRPLRAVAAQPARAGALLGVRARCARLLI